MPFRFVPMTAGYAEASIAWTYEGLYAVYGIDLDNPDDQRELDPASWPDRVFAALDADDAFVGIFQIDDLDDVMTIELYLRPDLTGKSLGEEFLRAGLDFAVRECGYSGAEVRLWVSDFNRRASTVYQRTGFRITGSRMRRSRGSVERRLLGDEYLEHEMRLRLADLR